MFLLFSFVIAAVTFTAWRRATRTQTEQVLSQTNTVLQRLAELEARVDATKITVSQLGERLERPRRPHRPAPALARLPDGHPPRQGRRLARGADVRLRTVARGGRVGAAPARPAGCRHVAKLQHSAYRFDTGTASTFRNARSRGGAHAPIPRVQPTQCISDSIVMNKRKPGTAHAHHPPWRAAARKHARRRRVEHNAAPSGAFALAAECTVADASSLKIGPRQACSTSRQPVTLDISARAAHRHRGPAGPRRLRPRARVGRAAQVQWRGRAPAFDAAARLLGLHRMLKLPPRG